MNETAVFRPPERFNMAAYFLDARLREARGDRTALRTAQRDWSYREVHELANRLGNLLRDAGIEPEQRVLIALPDGPEYVGALFGTLKVGAVVVMVNPHLRPDAIAYFLEYTRAKVALVHADQREAFEEAARGARHLRQAVVVGTGAFDQRLSAASERLETFDSHRDDAAIWLFSGGTTGQPKAVVQSHASYANTTECYARRVLGYTEDDITLSVPKLFFGYATGSNLLFPFAAGGSAILFPERCSATVVFEKIERFRPTILINVPTMIQQMLAEPRAADRDLSSLRLATSAGEALPAELYERWRSTFGVELLDGLGTAEMWHIFLSNRPGEVRPGTLGTAVPGFDVRVRDDDGLDLPDGEVGWLWVRGGSRALGYWQQMDETMRAFRGEWYVSGDMVRRDADGYFTYCGRGDDMLKVSGKWLAPGEVENCLLTHDDVREAAVVGITDDDGLTRTYAFVVPAQPADATLAAHLRAYVRQRLESYKVPRDIVFMDELPRTHLGKVDRGKLRQLDEGGAA